MKIIFQKKYFFINNKKEGINKIFYENRKIKKITTYKNNLKNGIEKNYDINGSIKSIINYFNNEKFFEHIFDKRMLLFSKFYYNPNYYSIKKYKNSETVIEGEFLNNKLHNKLIIYFENKKIIYKYNEGDLISKYEFDKNNNLLEKTNYKNNVKNGLSYNYYYNNKLQSIKYYENDDLVKMYSWSINHHTQKNINFKNNIINGDYKIIGNYIDYILPYKNGKLHGFVIINYKLLRCKVMIKYINNEFANIYKKILKNNNKKIEIIISSNYLSYTKYYNNGNKHVVLKKIIYIHLNIILCIKNCFVNQL